ncbi:MAG: beta strand repeat-containing protein, partial [Novosphingobium meiothermophilum]
TGLGGIDVQTVRTGGGSGQNIVLTSNGPISATTLDAQNNLTIASLANPAASLTATTLTARDGSISAFAGSMALGSASAGQSVNLRSDGDIAVSGGLIAGTAAMSTGNITVSGITGSRAASFAAGAVNATTGQATVRADAQTIGSLRSATASTLDATGAVSLGSATVGGNLAVTSTGGDISLGTSGAQSIVANGRVTITATAGAIGRGAGSSALTVRSNDDDLGAADSLTLRAGNAVALGNAALNGGRTGTAAVSVRSDTAGVALGSALGSSFAGSAATTFAASGSILANTATATGGDTIAITGLGGIDVQTVRTGGGSGQNIVLTSNGPISATTLDAQNNLIIASLANPAASLTATTLTARDGSISAFAGSMALGSASAGQSVNLRSNGAIGVTGSVTAGTDLAVAGLTNARAASFSAAQATATGGMLDIKAALVNIGNATSGADTLIDGATVVLGRATAGTLPASGNLVITASGDITLGTAAGALISASGGVSMTSSGGSILRGAGASNLTIRSNSDGAGSGPLALTATTGAIALDGATLKGGTAGQSAITLNSGADTLFSVADGAGFTATTGGNFTSTGSIKAAGAAQIAATGAASIAQVETTGAGNAISVTAASADIGRVASAGDYSVAATGNIALGRAGALSQAAAGLVNISAGGNISQGAASLTLTANSDGAGAETLALSAGGTIGLGGAWLVGGTGAQASAVSVTSGGNAVVDRITSAALTVSSGGSFTSDNRIDAVGDAVITASGAVTLNQIFASGSGHDLSITTPGAVNVFSAGAARNLTIGGSAGGNVASVVAGNLFAVSGSVRVRATSSDITDIYAGNNVTVSGASAIIGNVAAGLSNPGGSLSINATGNVTLGKTAGNTQLATGAITVNAGGSITKGDAGLLTLTANSDGTGAEAMTLNAGGAIALAGARLNGGTAQQSAVSLSAGSSIRIERATSAAFTATAGTSFTADNDIVALGNAAITAGGPVALRAVTANGANNDITVVTPGAVAALSLTAARNVTVEGPSGSSAASFTAGSVTATAGAISVRAGATDIGSATSGTNTTVSGTTAALGIVSSGGNYTVSTTGDVTLGKFAGQTQSARGAIAITSTGGSIRQGATGLLTMTANSDGVGTETLALSAGSAIALGGAQLNGGTNRQSAVNLTSVGNTEIAGANASAFTATAGTASAQAAFTANRAVRAATNMTITANGKVTLGDGGSAGNAVRISARDATIGDDLSAATIELFNTAPSGSTIIGGTAESIAGNFVLDRNEAARLKATGTLTLGADAAHDVEIRQVNFTVPSTVQVLARGKRIDVTGRITFDADTVLKLGSFGAAAADQTSIIRLNSQAGGAIYSPGGVLELSAANIAAGNNEFGTALNAQASGTGAGTGSIAEAIKLNLNPGSPLYTSANGGGAAMIETGSMKVTFSGFAMFQNTNNIDGSKGAINLLSTGVTLGGGNALALDIVSGAAQPVFALFGSVNGIVNAATALLGNPPIGRYTNVSASRINGCIIGGGSCNSVQNLTPSLTGLENIRTTIFTVKPDFVVPFDPLVGTNNDALFDDVGSFGLGELPMTPIECSDPNGSCDVQKKDGK